MAYDKATTVEQICAFVQTKFDELNARLTHIEKAVNPLQSAEVPSTIVRKYEPLNTMGWSQWKWDLRCLNKIVPNRMFVKTIGFDPVAYILVLERTKITNNFYINKTSMDFLMKDSIKKIKDRRARMVTNYPDGKVLIDGEFFIDELYVELHDKPLNTTNIAVGSSPFWFVNDKGKFAPYNPSHYSEVRAG